MNELVLEFDACCYFKDAPKAKHHHKVINSSRVDKNTINKQRVGYSEDADDHGDINSGLSINDVDPGHLIPL